jgi:hypothetical protein
MGGGNKVNQQIEKDRVAAMQTQNQLLTQASQESPEDKRWKQRSAAWDNWIKGKNFGTAPEGELLGFDLWNPSHVAAQSAKMDDITGVGAVGLGGDDSTALQLAKHRQSDEAAQNAGQAYESAVYDTDAYYKNAAPGYMQSRDNKFGNLFGQSSQNANALTEQWMKMANAPKPWQQILGGVLGGLAGGAAKGPLAFI